MPSHARGAGAADARAAEGAREAAGRSLADGGRIREGARGRARAGHDGKRDARRDGVPPDGSGGAGTTGHAGAGHRASGPTDGSGNAGGGRPGTGHAGFGHALPRHASSGNPVSRNPLSGDALSAGGISRHAGRGHALSAGRRRALSGDAGGRARPIRRRPATRPAHTRRCLRMPGVRRRIRPEAIPPPIPPRRTIPLPRADRDADSSSGSSRPWSCAGVIGTAVLIVLLRPSASTDRPERPPVTLRSPETAGGSVTAAPVTPLETVSVAPSTTLPAPTVATAPVARPAPTPLSRRPVAPVTTARADRGWTPPAVAPPTTLPAVAEPVRAAPAAAAFPGAGKVDLGEKFYEKTLTYEEGQPLSFDGHVGPLKADNVQFSVGEKKGRFGKVDDLRDRSARGDPGPGLSQGCRRVGLQADRRPARRERPATRQARGWRELRGRDQDHRRDSRHPEGARRAPFAASRSDSKPRRTDPFVPESLTTMPLALLLALALAPGRGRVPRAASPRRRRRGNPRRRPRARARARAAHTARRRARVRPPDRLPGEVAGEGASRGPALDERLVRLLRRSRCRSCSRWARCPRPIRPSRGRRAARARRQVTRPRTRLRVRHAAGRRRRPSWPSS